MSTFEAFSQLPLDLQRKIAGIAVANQVTAKGMTIKNLAHMKTTSTLFRDVIKNKKLKVNELNYMVEQMYRKIRKFQIAQRRNEKKVMIEVNAPDSNDIAWTGDVIFNTRTSRITEVIVNKVEPNTENAKGYVVRDTSHWPKTPFIPMWTGAFVRVAGIIAPTVVTLDMHDQLMKDLHTTVKNIDKRLPVLHGVNLNDNNAEPKKVTPLANKPTHYSRQDMTGILGHSEAVNTYLRKSVKQSPKMSSSRSANKTK